jgi:succinoglycan biosynthesis transport protein ExoP
MEDLSLYDIIAIFRRRRFVFALTFGAIFLTTALFAMQWSRYRAMVTVQIEQPYISSSVATMGDATDNVMGLADRRISQIQQKVTSIESLSEIIVRLNLYPKLNKQLSSDKLTEMMRNNIHLNFISSAISNPAAAQKESIEQLSAIAFTLHFDYSDPELTKLALDALVSRFIEEEANQRKTRSEETSAFLDTELSTLEQTIKEQESKIAEFKAQHGESGPNAMMFNQQASLSNNLNLQNIESQIGTTQATISTLAGQLAGTDPYAPTVEDGKMLNSPTSQLKALQAQYASLTGRYGPEHPDVVKVSEQIRALKAQRETSYRIASDADNPLYLQLSGQLSAARAQLSALMTQKATLKAQQEKYDRMLAENPGLEKEMSQLTLDLDNAKERYRSLKDKRLAADMKSKLESGKHSARLKVINPASIPESTTPARKLLLMAGLIFALIGGLGMVIIVEAFSQSVRGANHLAAIVGIAPLVSIPHIHAKT